MKTPILTSLISIWLVVSACVAAAETAERTLKIEYVATVSDIPESAKNLELWVPVPKSNKHQEILDVNVESPFTYEITEDGKYGNEMVYVKAENPPEDIEITVSYKAKRYANSEEFGRCSDTVILEHALEAQKMIPLGDDVKEMALEVVGDETDVLARALALYGKTYDHLTYDKSGTGWGRGDFYYACEVARGNCSDFHSYFIGLCRNIGIPAYFEIGVSIPPERGEGKTGGYHCWGYFWQGENWVPVDISEADKHPELKDFYFGNLDENRVAFTVGRDLVLNPPQNGDPLNFFINPYAEVDGKVHSGVSKEVKYKDL